MSGAIRPIDHGPARQPAPVSGVPRVHEHQRDEREQPQRDRRGPAEDEGAQPDGPDAEGHIDVLA